MISNQLAQAYDAAYAARVLGWIERIPDLQKDRMELIKTLLETESPSKERLEAVMKDCELPRRPPIYIPSQWREIYRNRIEEMWRDTMVECKEDFFLNNVQWGDFEQYARAKQLPILL